ncbi:ABC transporter permease [Fodinicola acaciae]|uniref:ABC transporter permease n=1 Tax=Fodinicola acaciae TaxID=2681555 RepID=UPI0013D03985|nr:ABC transporter permease [Fodinicola acaciae]
MTTTTTERPKAYPPPVEALLPKARKLTAKLGEVPSRNRLMTELRIGAPKARAVLDALTAPSDQTDNIPAATSPNRPAVVPAEATGDSGQQTREQTEFIAETTAGTAPLSADVVKPESPQVATSVDPGTAEQPKPASKPQKSVKTWPVLLLAAPAFVAIWSGWVGLGALTGFGVVHPLPGILDGFSINTAITLPIGVETYAAYALRAWLTTTAPTTARTFAKVSAIGALILGALGQIAYHLMSAAGITTAPWWITTAVACLPVAVLGMGAALAHLLRTDSSADSSGS